jgi:hypothetical protein
VFALLRLLPGTDRDKDAEILTLRHQLAVLQHQLDGQRVRFGPADRAWLAALLHRLPKPTLHTLRLLVRPDTILRWHRDLQYSPPHGGAAASPTGPATQAASWLNRLVTLSGHSGWPLNLYRERNANGRHPATLTALDFASSAMCPKGTNPALTMAFCPVLAKLLLAPPLARANKNCPMCTS